MCIKMRKVISKGKRRKIPNKIKTVKNRNKNPEFPRDMSHVKGSPSFMWVTKILLDKRKITLYKEIARINGVITVCLAWSKNLRRVLFWLGKERWVITPAPKHAPKIYFRCNQIMHLNITTAYLNFKQFLQILIGGSYYLLFLWSFSKTFSK